MSFDFKTQMQASGARNLQEGLGLITASLLPPHMQNTAYQQGIAAGEQAAQAVQMRFWEKQSEQVRKLRMKPIWESIQQENEQMLEDLVTSVVPVDRVLSPDEHREYLNRDRQQAGPRTELIPQGKGEGAGPPKPMPMPQEAGPNPTLAGQAVGSTLSEEALSVFDPAGQQWVPLSSAKGISIVNNRYAKSGQFKEQAMMELMNIIAEYPNNPLLNKIGQAMIDNVINQSNEATQGTRDPVKAQEMHDARQLAEAELQGQRQENERKAQEIRVGRRSERMSIGGENAAVNEARMLAHTDKKFLDLLEPEDAAALLDPKRPPLSPEASARVVQAAGLYRERQKEGIALRKSEKVFQIPSTLWNQPETWLTAAQNDQNSGIHRRYNMEMADAITDVYTGFAQLRNAGKGTQAIKELVALGATEAEAKYWVDNPGGKLPETVLEAMKAKSLGGEVQEKANLQAMIGFLEEQVGRQPGLEKQMRELLNARIDLFDAELDRKGKPPLDRERMQADLYGSFVRSFYPRAKFLKVGQGPGELSAGVERALVELNRARGIIPGEAPTPSAGGGTPAPVIETPKVKPTAAELFTQPPKAPPAGNVPKTQAWLQERDIEPTVEGVQKYRQEILEAKKKNSDTYRALQRREHARSKGSASSPRVYLTSKDREEGRKRILAEKSLETIAAEKEYGIKKRRYIAELKVLDGVEKTMESTEQEANVREAILAVLERHPLYKPSKAEIMRTIGKRYDYPRSTVEKVIKQLGIK